MTAALPLDGYRVLNLADEKGASCGKLLADLGADVIKIEPPWGDPARNIGPFFHSEAHPEKSLFWFAYYTDQRSITLNLENADGRKILRRLVKSADFIVESFRPGYLRKLGLGYSAIRKIRPSAIMVSIAPFGQEGPYHNWKGSDIVNSAMGGTMFVIGDPDRPPVRVGGGEQTYLVAGANAAAGALIAHYYRESTGIGQHVDASGQEASSSASGVHYTHWDAKDTAEEHIGFILPRFGNAVLRWKKLLQRVYRCRDGYVSWEMRVAGMANLTQALVDWMIREGEAGDMKQVRWAELDLATMSVEDYERWNAMIAGFLSRHTVAEFEEEVAGRNPSYSHFPLNTPADVVKNAQLAAREYWFDIDYPELGATIVHPGAPYKCTDVKWKKPRRAPLIGEHNDEVYRGELGLSKKRICLLRQANAI